MQEAASSSCTEACDVYKVQYQNQQGLGALIVHIDSNRRQGTEGAARQQNAAGILPQEGGLLGGKDNVSAALFNTDEAATGTGH
ncbi:hypothetical protein [Paraflavitalea speifideaquila]|uniref:hypothetical protein n=1 Tax=Paraflavitalea speifideaquila TaxID=3076558 RepID=UPI0028E8CD51|nr:hypothetical protein [Paraflavitalea speifideiaquila]